MSLITLPPNDPKGRAVKCDQCNQEMTHHVSCSGDMIRYADGMICSPSTDHFHEPSGFCHDCGAPHGTYHHPGCDAERCPRCNGQLISCGCDPL